MDTNLSVIIPDKSLEKLEFNHSFIINRAGYYHKITDHNVKRDGINEYILLICVDGRGYVETENQSYVILKGNIAILDKNTPHSYGSDNSDPWSIYWVHFSSKNMKSYYKLLDNKLMGRIFIREDYTSLAEYIRKILSCLTVGYDTINISQACCHLQLLLLAILKADTNINSNNTYIISAIKYMKENIYKDLILEDIAGYLSISSYYLIRIFKKHTQITPKQYYNKLKIEKACQLLTATNQSISEISNKLSYNNSFYFSQQFKKIIGVSPSVYRRYSETKY